MRNVAESARHPRRFSAGTLSYFLLLSRLRSLFTKFRIDLHGSLRYRPHGVNEWMCRNSCHTPSRPGRVPASLPPRRTCSSQNLLRFVPWYCRSYHYRNRNFFQKYVAKRTHVSVSTIGRENDVEACVTNRLTELLNKTLTDILTHARRRRT